MRKRDHCTLPAILACILVTTSCGSPGGERDASVEEALEDPVPDAAEDAFEDGEDAPGDSVDVEEDEGWTPPELEWAPCSLYEGEDDGLAECAVLEAPMRWGEPDGRTFPVVAKRLPRSVPALGAQIWYLEGGPGGAGTYGYAQYLHWTRRTFPTYEAYTLDARGTGHSQFLPCPADGTMREVDFASTIDEVQYCIDHLAAEHGDDLDVYGATQASHDLAAFIEATRVEGSRVFLWGNSAGTHWAHRFLQLYPDAVDGVILEALLSPEFFGLFQEEGQETVLGAILDQCAADTFCSSKLPDPHASLAALFASLDGGHCPTLGWTASDLRAVIGIYLYYRPYNEAIPAVIYRLSRCDPGDVTALEALYDSLGWVPDADTGFSIAVYFNEYLSEMYDHPDYTTNDDYIAYLDALYTDALLLDGSGYLMNDIFLRWPTYDEPLDGLWADTATPLLLMQGHLDPATPYFMSASMETHFTAAHQHYIDFQHASHGVVFGTPYVDGSSRGDCGVDLVTAFLADPGADLDLSCVSLTTALDFEGRSDAPRVMGTPDFWEN